VSGRWPSSTAGSSIASDQASSSPARHEDDDRYGLGYRNATLAERLSVPAELRSGR
jgi:hypothetical protein